MLCDRGGVSSSMLLLGREMAKRGIDSEYWFCKTSSRFPEFQETGRATLLTLARRETIHGSQSFLAEREAVRAA